MAYEDALEGVRDLKFLFEDLQDDRDETDSISQHVINFECREILPKYSENRDFPSTNRGLKIESKRLRTVSEKILKKFNRPLPYHEDGVAALLTFKSALGDEQVKKLLSYLGEVSTDPVFNVLYHASNQAIVHMKATSYTFLGEKIVEGNGFTINDIMITDLEALLLDTIPSHFLELSTPKSIGEDIQMQLSSVLVTFCGSFNYLRLFEADEPDQKPTLSSVALTLLFSKRAQANATKISALLSNEPWTRYQPPKSVRVPFEELFQLKSHPAPLLGLISGNDIPGVRISVRFSLKKEEMVEFYRVLTGKSPVCRSDKSDTSFFIYPVAKNLELQLIHNSTTHSDPSKYIAIFFRIADHVKISSALHRPLTPIDAGYWETYDPVGNRIVLFTPFE